MAIWALLASNWRLAISTWLLTFVGLTGTPTNPTAATPLALPLITQSNSTELTVAAQPSESTVVKPTIGMWLSANEIAALPTSGTAWNALKAAADKSAGTADLSDQDSDVNIQILAKALVYARTGQAAYRADVVAAIQTITHKNTEQGGRTLALGRELTAYILAADLIDLANYDATLNTQFKAKLRELLGKTLDGLTLRSTQENRPNNWGTHAGAARAAIAIYLGDTAELQRTAAVFRGWLGDRSAYTGFSYGDLSWQADPKNPVGINPAGATKQGRSIDGAIPDDMRRGGSYQWPPKSTGYPWEGLQGAVVTAELLHRAGYPAWEWQDRALLRATQFLYAIDWPATGDDTWQIWLINRAYGTSFPTSAKSNPGKNMGWTEWSHGPRSNQPTNQPPIVNAGADGSTNHATTTLAGTVSDDGLPNNKLTNSWSKVSGPGTVTFGNANAANTSASFSQAGLYRLRLTANDGALSSSDEVQITVNAPSTNHSNQAPVINAGADVTIQLAATAALDGTVNDDGLPNNTLTSSWSKVSGPGTVTFGNANAVDTSASFSQAGLYTLRLTANDGALSSSDEVQVQVNAQASQSALLFAPIADTYVDSKQATRNYGTKNAMNLRAGDPARSSYLQFQVSGLSDTVLSAKLRLYVTDESNNGGSLYQVANTVTSGSNVWTEQGLTWQNAPPMNGTPLGALSTVNRNTWVEFDVTAVIQGNGLYSFGLLTSSSNSAIYSTREGSNPPILVISTADGGSSSAGVSVDTLPAVTTYADEEAEGALDVAVPDDAFSEEDANEEDASEEATSEAETDEAAPAERVDEEQGDNATQLFLPLIQQP
ncbi:MAG: DNRLRE domain-containing protein [Caldilineaceae bacterium]|nr:DNRLRE domain-containing protein [Caldilineaceae bacterium]